MPRANPFLKTESAEPFVPLGVSPSPLPDVPAKRIPDDDELLPRLFDGPHPILTRQQRRTASAILGMAGLSFLPGRLITSLKMHDAFSACRFFFLAVGVKYSDLATSEAEREFLQYCLEVLAETDADTRRAGLKDAAIYELIRTRDRSRIENLTETLRLASGVAILIRTLKSDFGGCASFVARAEARLTTWPTLDIATAGKLRESAQAWKSLQNEYTALLDSIHLYLAHLHHSPPTSTTEWELAGIVAELDRIRHEATSGALDPVAAIETLRGIEDDLKAATKDGFTAGDETPRGEGPSEDDVAKSLEILGLASVEGLTAESVKKSFRTKALRAHPDKGGDAAGFMELQDARDLLMDYLERLVAV